ncbi:transglycosylase domain-containing protein [Mesonia sp. HuA40]|uniref:transglycosylase domain-containing protein n=1 Tax=Mesonia sp. HuA40 TaxID=2602761 RepID=UPI0011CC1A13|nr:transglycosylase domain-containing protein [Mesonia sp. HuA40]TXK70965.1 penicillin-binding protein [Mesonia sp. HuA40]
MKVWLKKILWLFAGLGIVFIAFYLSIYWGAFGKIPSKEELKNLKQSVATEIVDDQGSLLGKVYIYDRQAVSFSEFPPHLVNALIATEDSRFYDHDGIDAKSLLRVFFKTILLSDKSSGGGSTLTLQLAKNLYGREAYPVFSIVINKLKESIVAQRIEDLYSKEEIIELYLNTVPFPDNTYGVESAAFKFFNTKTKNLTVAQSATLIGSLKANHSYNPRLFPERSQLRRDVVLKQMNKYNYLSTKKTNQLIAQKIKLDYQYFSPNQGVAGYFRAKVRQQTEQIIQKHKLKQANGELYNILTDGLRIETTLNKPMQLVAERAMKKHMSRLQSQFEKGYGKNAPWLRNKTAFNWALQQLPYYKKLKSQNLSLTEIKDSLNRKQKVKVFDWKEPTVKNLSILDSIEHYSKFLNLGFVALEPNTGEIKSYLGGIDYTYFKYDHVSQSKRQVGSLFKPIVYTAAIENGLAPCHYYNPSAVTYTDMKNWTPKNASKKDKEPEHINYSLERALSESINTIAVKVLQEVGIEKTIEQAKKMGIQQELPKVPSIALGVTDVKLLDMARVYSTFVNDGMAPEPVFIKTIKNKRGEIIWSQEQQNKSNKKEAAFSNFTRQVMLSFMQSTVNKGTARRLRTTYRLNNAIAGKTGTTQNNKDAWFAAITPKLVCLTWVGNDNAKINFSSTAIGQGANAALPMFAEFYSALSKIKEFDAITQARFEPISKEVKKAIECDDEKKDGLLKRIFGKNKDEKTFHEDKQKKKKGIFSWFKKN